MHHRIADFTGSCFALLSTIFYVRADILAWPVGLIAICINMYLYFRTGLYADMAKESVYFFSMFYGWYEWARGGNNQTGMPITHLSWELAQKLMAVAATSFVILAFILFQFTNSRVPFWDASTTVLSLTAQWLTCRKIMECWVLWFVVDAAYAGLYFYKALPWHGALLLLYLGLAIAGWWRWSELRVKLVPSV